MPKALVLGGATGLLGQALMRVLRKRGWETASLGRQDGDMFDSRFLRAQLEKANADAIFNTIAWTQVDDAEDHPEAALKINRVFPELLCREIARLEKGHLAHFSTDFVFSGAHDKLWTESDEPNPQSVYGRTKLEGEKAVLNILPERSCVLRTAWLFGPGRKNFVETILNVSRKRDIVTVVHDQMGSPTYTMDLADWSARLAEARASGIWHTVNSGRASWCELAAEAIALASIPCKAEPITSGQWPQKARRPDDSTLDNSKLANFLGFKPRPWPQALRDYLFADLNVAEH